MNYTTKTEEILSRLKSVSGSRTDIDLARWLDISHQAIYSARKRDRVPFAWISKASERFNINSDWVLHGTGQAQRKATLPEEKQASFTYLQEQVANRHAPEPDSRDFDLGADQDEAQEQSNGLEIGRLGNADIAMIPLVEARLSAGQGSFETSNHSDNKYAFRLDFLQRKGRPEAMVLMTVDGTSMEPAIMDGDMVLIDQSQTEPRPGRIYAVAVEDMVYLKLVNAEPGQLILSSYNPDYKPIIVDTRDQMQDTVRIIGRAVWWCREA